MLTPAFRTEWLDETHSTNVLAAERAQAGERGPVWIAARRQNAGRGRRGRAWSSLDGNLFTTGLFTFSVEPADAAQLSFAAALAVAEVCDIALKHPEAVQVKWPNDVLVHDRKVAGILLESGGAPGGGLWLAVGIGVNIATAPEDVERPAISLRDAGGKLEREAALDQLARAFQKHVMSWQTAGFGPIRDKWLARAKGLGQPCEVRLDHETLKGVFGDLGPDGSLRLDLASGEHRYISAGDVYFPGR